MAVHSHAHSPRFSDASRSVARASVARPAALAPLAPLAGMLALGALALTLIGCQSPLDPPPHWPRNAPSSREPAARPLTPRDAPRAAAPSPATTSPATTSPATQPRDARASLAEHAGPAAYVALALKQNPAIQAARRRIRRMAARVPQATSLQDPMLQIAPFGEMAETAAGQTAVMAGVSQTLPLPAKLRTRGRIATRDVAMARQRLRQTRRRIARDVRRAYWRYYLATRSIDITRQHRAVLRRFHETVKAKYRAGTTAQADVLRAATELSRIEQKLTTLRQRRESAGAMLNRLMDRPGRRALPEPKQLTFRETTWRLNELLQRAAGRHPELKRLRESISKYRQRRRLANLNRWPDLTLSAQYNVVDDDGLSPVANGEDQWWFGLGFNIPLWQSKRDAAEREAQQGIFEALAQLNDAHNTVAFRVRDALARFQSQQEQVALFQRTILPQARQTLRASLSEYRAGRTDFLDVIEHWRRRLQLELAHHKALAQLEQDFADLKAQVGPGLDRHPPRAATAPASQPASQPNPDPTPESSNE